MSEELLADLWREIDAAEAELIEREAELVDLRVELSAFRLEYDTRVGRKVEELEEVETEIKRCQQRISQYRQWGPGGLPRTRSGENYVPVEEQYRRTWQEPEEPSFPPPDWLTRAYQRSAQPTEWGRVPHPWGAKQWAAIEARIKKLYRQLCRRFHPDLTQNEAEWAWRTEMMAAVNAAYTGRKKDMRRSLAELEALAQKPDYSTAKVGAGEQRVDALRERLRQIQQRLREVRQEIRGLTNGQTMQMLLEVKLARRYGRDLLAELEADVEKDLERRRAELGFLKAQLKQLGIG